MGNVRKFQRKQPHTIKKLLFILLLLAIGCYVMFDLFRITTIRIQGSQRYSEEEMKEFLMTETLDRNSLYFFLKYTYGEKPVMPFIQDFDITLVDNHTVELTVYEKLVTGCVEFMGEYMYFDKDGIVVESSSKRESGVPQIVGLTFQRIALHEEIQIQAQELFETILDLTKLIRQYDIAVDVISFSKEYEVTLTCGNSKVLLGKHEFYDIPLSQLNSILAASDGVAYSYDMRKYTEPGQKFIVKKLEQK